MSMMKCAECECLVDTDAEPESFVQIGDMRKTEDWICLCQWCREAREYEIEVDDYDAMRRDDFHTYQRTPTPEKKP